MTYSAATGIDSVFGPPLGACGERESIDLHPVALRGYGGCAERVYRVAPWSKRGRSGQWRRLGFLHAGAAPLHARSGRAARFTPILRQHHVGEGAGSSQMASARR